MRALSLVATASALMAGPLAAPAAAAPGVVLLNVTGSGCRPNTTAAALSGDRAAITITYRTYSVAGPGANRSTSKDCRINLKIEPWPGYAPTITSVDYRGFATLASGSLAQLAASYGFHGATHVESAAARLAGPYSDGWAASDRAEGGLVTGNCGGSSVLDLDSTLTLTSAPGGSATDLVAMDSTDGVGPDSSLHLMWKRCT